jgi:hypothetical protein
MLTWTNNRFSDSPIWEQQPDVFKEQGVDSYTEANSSFWATSNPTIANAYAELILSYINDYISQKGHTKDTPIPVNIIELGAGSGRFTYYLLNAIEHLLSFNTTPECHIQYHMTSLSPDHLRFWQQHEKLRPFFKEGQLNCHRFDVFNDGQLPFEVAQGPVILIANYFFDILPFDWFSVKNGAVSELLSSGAPINDNGSIKISLSESPLNGSAVSSNYFDEPILNSLLDQHAQKLEDGHISLPVGGYRAILRLKEYIGDHMMIMADNGLCTAEEQKKYRVPSRLLATRDMYVFQVDMLCVKEFYSLLGGDGLVADIDYSPLDVSVYVSHMNPEDHPHLSKSYDSLFRNFGPVELLYYVSELERGLVNKTFKPTADWMFATLKLCKWDPYVFLMINSSLLIQFSETLPSVKAKFNDAIAHIWENYFHISLDDNVAFELGVLSASLGEFSQAISLFEFCIQNGQDSPNLHFNLGFCFYKLQKVGKALTHLNHTLRLDPGHDKAKRWRELIQQR